MRLCRLRVTDFAGIAQADIELGPGLNVLYGPNDLGKSTLADAIRVALLLPHSSSHAEQYVSWTGGSRPLVELTFQTEPQRIWRVKKQFGKSGFSLLEESRDNVTFNEVEKARRVDGRLRELLRWGIPEPGGAGAAKGLPDSFLATVLLSTQADVAAVLRQSLEEDPTGSGKERIAAALQAVAQDPLFLSLLRRTQERRDEAYTEKGMKKGSKDSPFRKAADRVRQLREEKERWQQAVDDSESVERELRGLANKRTRLEERVSGETGRLATVERLARETAALRVADDQVQQAAQQVGRIQQIERDIAAAGQSVQQLADRRAAAEEAASAAQEGLAQANAPLDEAQRALESFSVAGAGADTVERQSLEIRLAAAEKAASDAGRRIQQADAALKKLDEARAAEAEHRRLSEDLRRLEELLSGATAQERSAQSHLQQLDLLDRALALRNAQTDLELAGAAVQRASVIGSRADALSTALQSLADRRSRLDLPTPDVVSAMRRLENDLGAARGALNVGIVVTVNPLRPLDLRVSKDGSATQEIAAGEALALEANTSVDLEIRGVASVELRGGRREAQETLRALEQRWATELAPRLSAAGAADLNELDARLAEARTLESEIATTTTELATLQEQLAASTGAEGAQRAAVERLRTCRAALGKASPEPLLEELRTRGADAAGGLRKRKERSAKALETARAKAVEAQTAHGVGEERFRNSTSRLDAANTARDAAVGELSGGLPEAHAAAHAALTSSDAERSRVKNEIETMTQRLESARRQADAALTTARVVADKARKAAETIQKR
jgi:DNA repair exonuclease SbcCD ATPase subunit